MPKYPVIDTLRHNGTRYLPGREVEMSETEAAKVRPGVLGAPLPAAEKAAAEKAAAEKAAAEKAAAEKAAAEKAAAEKSTKKGGK